MKLSIEKAIKAFLDGKKEIRACYFSNNDSSAPKLAYKVDFPRLEIILEGEQEMLWDNDGQLMQEIMTVNDVLFVCARSWNKPLWSKPVTTLSILFGKQQLGISLLHWDGNCFTPTQQLNAVRRGPRVGTFIIQALTELSMNYKPAQSAKTAASLILSLLSHTHELLTSNIETASKATNLFEGIRQYIDNQFKQNISRDFLAELFHISPNYLSYLFQREGKIGLNEYIIQVRLEHAKMLLKRYNMNIKEVALDSGFSDSNYFCRIFKRKTARSPSEYRRQYHSKIYDKSQ